MDIRPSAVIDWYIWMYALQQLVVVAKRLFSNDLV
jgi:hypothetical protein